MKIKVCGMREPENILDLDQTGVDMIGFIFYPGSKRYVGDREMVETRNVSRVGVFVNEDLEVIRKEAEKWALDVIQLHGDESPKDCTALAGERWELVKAFAVDDQFDFGRLEPYLSVVQYFLFDTKGTGYGGHGVTFDWNILRKYSYDKPFWLSGGIHPGLTASIKQLDFPQLYALDVNSGFEVRPGLKDINLIKQFAHEIQH